MYNDYNQETENVQQNISDYITNNTQEQRQSHIDLSSECYGYYLTKNSRTGRKIGDLAGNRQSMIKAKENLLKFLNILDFKSYKIHTCHKCQNHSKSSNFVCINPQHIYFGTASENEMDKDPEVRKKAIANVTYVNQTISTCPYCQKSGQTANMYRWHFDNCKHNPQNISKAS